MRPIKFRVWEDSYFSLSEALELGYAVIQHNRPDSFEIEGGFESTVIEQFTGLLDKNGKEIYEGDIVRCFDNSGEKVYDREVDFYGFRQEIWGEEYDGNTRVEVIGNIHENPELWKKE